jgi:heptosyltransferase-2
VASNILIIDFGQMGDVVLSLPSLRAVRQHYPHARITALAGKAGEDIIRMSGYVDAVIAVDRVKMKYGSKLDAGFQIIKLIREVRRPGFDLVIDLHSLAETNLLMWATGAQRRCGARRPRRSLDFLINIKPPIWELHKHAVDRYLDVLIPLGIENASTELMLRTLPEFDTEAEKILNREGVKHDDFLIGLNPGGAFPPRRWPKDRFVELAKLLTQKQGIKCAVFAGPEESDLAKEIADCVGNNSVMVLDKNTITLSLYLLASLAARCKLFITNDTGPMHVATAVGTPTIALMDRPAPWAFDPRGVQHHVIYGNGVASITVDEVYQASCRIIQSSAAQL